MGKELSDIFFQLNIKTMKTMACKQLAALSKKHAMEMFQKGDKPHLDAMNEMQKMMMSPDSMNKWMESKRKEFESLPDVK
jgi:uncharacterized iron-regulated protein